jgi:hypothetical protein
VLESYLGAGVIDVCIINGRAAQGVAAERYSAVGAEEVQWSSAALARAGALPIVADLLVPDQFPTRHDPEKLADVVLCLSRGLLRGDRDRDDEPATVPVGRGSSAEPTLGWGGREIEVLAEPSRF